MKKVQHSITRTCLHYQCFLGWEYCVEAGLGGWVASERNIHLCKRRRWVRTRIRVHDPKVAEKKVMYYS